WQQYYSTPYSF
nr:immunoglobulin light chain junction region [Macaca mulatta]